MLNNKFLNKYKNIKTINKIKIKWVYVKGETLQQMKQP